MKTFFLVLFLASLLNAQYLTFQPTYNLSNTSYATSDYHAVFSQDNWYYVVWQDNGEIKFKSSSDYGATWTPNLLIASSSSIMGWPVVAADGQKVYVLFHQNPGDYEIIFMSSDNHGQTWGSGTIISGMDIGAITPQLYVNGANLFAVWEQKINNYYDIILRRSTDQGLTWLPEQNISNTPSLNSRWVQIQGLGNHIYCAWIDQSTYPLGDIFFRKSNDNGVTWDAAINVTNDARPQNRFCMKNNYNGNISIATDDIPGSFNFDEIYLLKSTNEGLTWTAPVNITNNPGNSNAPWIEVYENNILFSWSDNTQSAPAYDNSDIFFKWSSDGGVTWRDSLNLSSNTESSSRPRICWGFNGPLTNIWTELSVIWYDYSTGDAELLARKGILVVTPVELVSFSADCIDQSVNFKWSTTTEKNNKGYELLRKLTNNLESSWENVAFITGNGTTTEQRNYSYIDLVPLPGKYNYRLTQIDYDGTTEILKEVEIEVDAPNKFTLSQNYPNPFNPETRINYSVKNQSVVNISIYDVLGNKVKEVLNDLKEPGNYNLNFNGKDFSSGIYYYKMTSGDFVSVKKMLLLK